MKFEGISDSEALELLESPDAEFAALIARADEVRRAAFGRKVTTCAIINAKSGGCGEDCAFCPQSVTSTTQVDKYPLKEPEEIATAACAAAANHAGNFGIVTAGRSINVEHERASVLSTVSAIAEGGKIDPCASLGVVDENFLKSLKNAGLESYHHNLEASESFYTNICTTRTFKDNAETVRAAKKVGLKVCSGCLFGMGETPGQRVELLASVRSLEVDSVPVNFLVPREGTRLCEKSAPPPMSPIECLKIIAVARLMLPDKTIRVCGGREPNLREMQSWIFAAGANALMIGSYLTTTGRNIDDDIRMIEDAGMELVREW